MEVPVAFSGLEPGRLTLRSMGIGGALYLDGSRLRARKGLLEVPTRDGPVEVRYVPRRLGFDVPDLEVDGRQVEVVPALPVAALALAVLPLLLIFVGGALGGLLGGAAATANLAVMRTGMPWAARVPVCLVMTVLAVGATLALAGAVAVLLGAA